MDRTPKFTITLGIPLEIWPSAERIARGERALTLVVEKGSILAESFETADGFTGSELKLLSRRM
ncbi:MAG TPA: hypothetical protein VMW69_09810, partial [Spirochaetia bacterium]|nr:hypothetical protein [Spirochaetia bacterium]